MRVIAVIEDSDVIKKILKHLGLWDVKRKPWPMLRLSMLSPHMMNSRDPVRMIRLWFGFFGGTSYIRDLDYPAEGVETEE